jgi:hypothetical protein
MDSYMKYKYIILIVIFVFVGCVKFERIYRDENKNSFVSVLDKDNKIELLVDYFHEDASYSGPEKYYDKVLLDIRIKCNKTIIIDKIDLLVSDVNGSKIYFENFVLSGTGESDGTYSPKDLVYGSNVCLNAGRSSITYLYNKKDFNFSIIILKMDVSFHSDKREGVLRINKILYRDRKIKQNILQ